MSLLFFCHLRHSYKEKGKLNFSKMSVYSVSSLIQNREGQSLFIRGKTVSQTLENFFASSDKEICEEHTPIWFKNTHGIRKLVSRREKEVSIWDEARLGLQGLEGAVVIPHLSYFTSICASATVKIFFFPVVPNPKDLGFVCSPCLHSWFLEKRLSLCWLSADVSPLRGKKRRDCMYFYQCLNSVLILHVKTINIFVIILIRRAKPKSSHLEYRHLSNT